MKVEVTEVKISITVFTIIGIVVLILLYKTLYLNLNPPNVIIVATWKNNISEIIKSNLLKKYNIKINEIRVQSSSQLIELIDKRNSNYSIKKRVDVIIARDDIATALLDGRLARLNIDTLPNRNYLYEIGLEYYYDKSFIFMIPFSAVSYGYVVNTSYVNEMPDSWEDIFENQVLISDGQEIAVTASPFTLSRLISLSLGNVNFCHDATYMLTSKKIINAGRWGFKNNYSFHDAIHENLNVVITDSATANEMQYANSKYKFIQPTEGTYIHHNIVGIAQNSLKKPLAGKFINLFISSEITTQMVFSNGTYPIFITDNNYSFAYNEKYSYILGTENNQVLFYADCDDAVKEAHQKHWDAYFKNREKGNEKL